MERALIIREPHIDNILDNGKRWEMRSTQTKVRGRIGLIKAGSGVIVGEANLIDSFRKLSENEKKVYMGNHQVEDLSKLDKWCYPWILTNVIKYEKPIPYDHPQGAVIWVNLPVQIESGIHLIN